MYVDALGVAGVEEEDSYAAKLGDGTDFHSLGAAVLEDLHHTGAAPESLLPLHKDHGAWKEMDKCLALTYLCYFSD